VFLLAAFATNAAPIQKQQNSVTSLASASDEQPTQDAGLLSPGFLSTSGSQIVDSSGRPQRLACVGYNEPGSHIPGDPAGMKKAGFNCARFPFAESRLISTFPMMDTIVDAATRLGLKIIFDHHVDDAKDLCGGQQQNGLWFDVGEGSDNTDGCGNKGTVTADKFKADWVSVARHYAGNSTVIAFDLDNEPLVLGSHATPITWGTNGPTDILKMWEEVGSAIEAADPRLRLRECWRHGPNCGNLMLLQPVDELVFTVALQQGAFSIHACGHFFLDCFQGSLGPLDVTCQLFLGAEEAAMQILLIDVLVSLAVMLPVCIAAWIRTRRFGKPVRSYEWAASP
jgi:Cellulase (glycosyl hydrolase family 5)